MASEIDIINSALNLIGASNITVRTDDSESARVTNQRYDFVRDAVRKILTDEGAPFSITYIARVTDPNEYDGLLIETISARLAADIAFPLVASRTLSADLWALYEAKLSEARFVNATEGQPGSHDAVSDTGGIEANTFISARY